LGICDRAGGVFADVFESSAEGGQGKLCYEINGNWAEEVLNHKKEKMLAIYL
jgi:hypothetical protein